jgi:hypothetical protein
MSELTTQFRRKARELQVEEYSAWRLLAESS